MRNILPILFLLSLLTSLNAQKTIFKLWDLPKRGCSLDKPSTAAVMNSGAAMTEAEPDFRQMPTVPEGFSSIEELVDSLGRSVAARLGDESEYAIPRISWKDDLAFVRQNGLWGLRRNDTEQLIEPRFHHVIVDKDREGFIGYEEDGYNYYSVDGHAAFPVRYLHIQPTRWNNFIIRTAVGYGIIDAEGRELLAPKHEQIRLLSQGERPYAHVMLDEENTFLYHLETGKNTYYKAYAYAWQLLDDRYALVENKTLIDLEENRQVFCADNINISIVSQQQQTLLISRNDAPGEYRLIDYRGNLLTLEVVANAGHLQGKYRVVGVPQPHEPGRRAQMVHGVMDEDGKWVLPPRYLAYGREIVASRFLRIHNPKNENALINFKGDTLLPFRNYVHLGVTKDGRQLKAVYSTPDKTRKAELLDLKTLVRTPLDDPGIWARRPHGTCGGDTLYLASSAQGEVLVDADDRVIISGKGRIFKGPNPETYYTLKTSDRGQKWERQWLDCQGNARTFTVQGKEIDRFHSVVRLGPDLYFIRLQKQDGYFLFPDGTEVYSPYSWASSQGMVNDELFILRTDNGKHGMVDAQGQIVIPPVFNSLHLDRRIGLLKYALEEKKPQYMTLSGKPFLANRYNAVQATGLGNFRVRRGDLWGLVDGDGTELMEPVYPTLYISNGIVYARHSSYRGRAAYDLQGQPLPVSK